MREDGKIDYVEFPGTDLAAVKAFYGAAFGWTFTDYGPDYVAFEGEGTDGGFAAGPSGAPEKPLVVLYAHHLEPWRPRWPHPAGRSPARSSPFPAAGDSTSKTPPATSWRSGP